MFDGPNVADTTFGVSIVAVHVVASTGVQPDQLVTFDTPFGTAVIVTAAPFATAPVQTTWPVLPVWQSIAGADGAVRYPPYGDVNVVVIAGYVFAPSVRFVALKFAVTVFADVIDFTQTAPSSESHPTHETKLALVTLPGTSRTTPPVATATLQFVGLFVAQASAGVVAAESGSVPSVSSVTWPTAVSPCACIFA
jgi:hypothetical protein